MVPWPEAAAEAFTETVGESLLGTATAEGLHQVQGMPETVTEAVQSKAGTVKETFLEAVPPETVTESATETVEEPVLGRTTAEGLCHLQGEHAGQGRAQAPPSPGAEVCSC